MESLPLKEQDFGLQKRTGPSSGVVTSIVLVSQFLIIDQFYLLISLEGMWSFIRILMIFLVPFWDVHLHNE